jgi:putative ABC transport system permease protein
MAVYLRIALRNLLQARKRTLFLSTALGLVTALLVLLLAVSQGLGETIVTSATTLVSGHVNVGGFHKIRARDSDPVITGTPRIRAIIEERTPGLAYVVDRHRGWGRLVGSGGSLDTAIYGIDPEHEARFFAALALARESEYRDGGRDEVLGDVRRLAEPGTIVLFRKQARRLGVTVGDQVTISAPLADGSMNVADARVVAVAKDVGFMSDWSAFVPKRTNLSLWKSRDDVSGAVMVYLEDPSRAEETMAHLRGVLEGEGYTLMDHRPEAFPMKFEAVAAADWTGQRLDLTTWRDEVSYVTWVVDVLDGLALVLVGILVMIIGDPQAGAPVVRLPLAKAVVAAAPPGWREALTMDGAGPGVTEEVFELSEAPVEGELAGEQFVIGEALPGGACRAAAVPACGSHCASAGAAGLH